MLVVNYPRSILLTVALDLLEEYLFKEISILSVIFSIPLLVLFMVKCLFTSFELALFYKKIFSSNDHNPY